MQVEISGTNKVIERPSQKACLVLDSTGDPILLRNQSTGEETSLDKVPSVVSHSWDSLDLKPAAAVGVASTVGSAVAVTLGLEFLRMLSGAFAFESNYHSDLGTTGSIGIGVGVGTGLLMTWLSHHGTESKYVYQTRTPFERRRLKKLFERCTGSAMPSVSKLPDSLVNRSEVNNSESFANLDSAKELNRYGNSFKNEIRLGDPSRPLYLKENGILRGWQSMYFTCQKEDSILFSNSYGVVHKTKDLAPWQYRFYKNMPFETNFSYALAVERSMLPQCDSLEYWRAREKSYRRWALRNVEFSRLYFGSGHALFLGAANEDQLASAFELGYRSLVHKGDWGWTYWMGTGLKSLNLNSTITNDYVVHLAHVENRMWFPYFSLMNHYVIRPFGFGLEYQLAWYDAWKTGVLENSGYFLHLSSSRLMLNYIVGVQKRNGEMRGVNGFQYQFVF